jgi:hypothetical protein
LVAATRLIPERAIRAALCPVGDRALSADLTFDPSEWATLGEAAEILRWKFDSSDGPQWRLLDLLRQRPSMACVVTATLPSIVNNELRAGLTPLPDRCQWASIDEIDWSASKVRVSPLLSETQWQSWCPSDHMLDVRVRRTEVLAAAQEERATLERGIAKRREVTARLFGELFWPVPRVLAWIAFRHEAAINASLGAATWYVTKAMWQLRDIDREETLLRALQEASLRALKDAKELPREFWAGAKAGDWPAVHFRREDVLTRWPQLPQVKRVHTPGSSPSANATTTEPVLTPAFEPTYLAPIRNKPGKGGVKMDAAIAAMRDAVERGAISVLELRQMKQESLGGLYPGAKRTLLAEARRRALVQIADEKARRQSSDKITTNDK